MTSLLLREPILAAPFRMVDEFFRTGWNGSARVTGFVPAMDVRETEDEYLVLLDVPGVKAQDVSIELNEQVLTISGSRVPVETGAAQVVERPFGSFVRTLTLPRGIDVDAVVADYQEGVLALHIPKPAGLKPKRIAIGSGSGQKQLEQ